jgi:hypothetical protein
MEAPLADTHVKYFILNVFLSGYKLRDGQLRNAMAIKLMDESTSDQWP